jgi:hypothetical protein
MLHITCEICRKKMTQITHTHLKKHNITFQEYKEMYPNAITCVPGTHEHSDSTKEAMRQSKLGTKLSKEHKDNISNGNKGKQVSEDTKQKIREKNTGKKHTEETKYLLSEMHKGKQISQETREKISKSLKGRFCGTEHSSYGKTLVRNYKGSEYTQVDGTLIHVRSSWELEVCKHLDSLNLNWRYELITYQFTDFMYTPDFFVLDENDKIVYIIEVKGWMDRRSVHKIEAFRRYHPNISLEVWTREVLVDKGIKIK